MNLLEMAAQLFMQNLGSRGSDLSTQGVMKGLEDLLGGKDGQMDLGDLVGLFKSQGLASMAQSWLGDGDNDSLTVQQVMATLGEPKVSAFAAQLGIDPQAAGSGLADTIPELIDKNSKGGDLLASVGGASGLMDIASKFLKR